MRLVDYLLVSTAFALFMWNTIPAVHGKFRTSSKVYLQPMEMIEVKVFL